MKEFLLELLAMFEVLEPDFIEQPQEQVLPGDEIIGVLSEELRGWHAVRSAFLDDRNARLEESAPQLLQFLKKPVNPSEEQVSLILNQRLVHAEYSFVDSILILGLKRAFPQLTVLLLSTEIVICENWQVVVRQSPVQKTVPDTGEPLVLGPDGRMIVAGLA